MEWSKSRLAQTCVKGISIIFCLVETYKTTPLSERKDNDFVQKSQNMTEYDILACIEGFSLINMWRGFHYKNMSMHCIYTEVFKDVKY